MDNQKIPIIGITMGDPAGIGPEIICKSLSNESLYETCQPIVIGSKHPMERALKAISSNQTLNIIKTPSEGIFTPKIINLIDVPLNFEYEPGVLKAENGQIAIDYMKKVHSMIVNGEIDATASGPSNKNAMKLSGSPYIGATELFAHFAGDLETSTVIEQGGCYIFQLTTHMSLRKALDSVTIESVTHALLEADRTLKQWGIPSPKIAISGLNPHCGEGGHLGTEEIEILIPAIKVAQDKGVDVDGPIAADSIYIKGLDNLYDGIIMLFHDTANIPIKLMDATLSSVVITAGLPFIRTTVAHGTAYDIAYQNIASCKKMLNCILVGANICKQVLRS